MKKILLSLSILMLTGLSPVTAWAARCPSPSLANVFVQLLDPEPRITDNKSLNQINSMAASHGLVQHGNRALGTTQSAVEGSLSMKFSGQQQRRGSQVIICLNVDAVNARFGHRSLIVNLPREYLRESCQYKVVRRHEMAHVAVNRQAVRKYAGIIKADLERETRRMGTLEVRTMSRGTDMFQKRLRAVFSSATQRFDQEIKGLHDQIDAPGSPYSATNACRSW